MAGTLTVLYYDDTDDNEANHQWRQLKNRMVNNSFDDTAAVSASNLPFHYVGGNPVVSCSIIDEIGLPLECNLVLNNSTYQRKDYVIDSLHHVDFAKLPLANGHVNQFNGLLPELTRIIVYDSSSFMTLFVGRVYKNEEPFLSYLGTSLKLQCFDALQELVEMGFTSLSEQESQYFINYVGEKDQADPPVLLSPAVPSYGQGNYPIHISRPLDEIKHIVLKTTFGTELTQEITFDGDHSSATTDHKIDANNNFLKGFTEADVLSTSVDRKYGYPSNHLKKLSQYGKESALSIIQKLSETQQWQDGTGSDPIKGRGCEYFLDATRTSPVLGTNAHQQQDFAFFRRGYYTTDDPATYGLTAQYATTDAIDGVQSTANDITRNMFNGFNFARFQEDNLTHVTLSHRGAEGTTLEDQTLLIQDSDKRRRIDIDLGMTSDKWAGVKNERSKTVEKITFSLMYVKPAANTDPNNYVIGDFRWKQFGNIWTQTTGTKPPLGYRDFRSFKQVTSLHKANGGTPAQNAKFTQVDNTDNGEASYRFKGVPHVTGATYVGSGSSQGKTWLGNVQYQGIDNDGFEFVILSDPQEEVIATLAENDVLYERGWYLGDEADLTAITPSYTSVRFRSYPSLTNKIKQPGFLNSTEQPAGGAYDAMRVMVGERLDSSTNDLVSRMRSGQFRIKDWPHTRWTGTAQSGTSTGILKPVIAATKTPLDYGMRRGCSVVKRGGSGIYAGYISAVNEAADTVAATLYKTSSLGTSYETTPTGAGAWSVGDNYDIYCPLRAGMSIKVDNSAAVTVGEHVIVSIEYSWDNGHVSSELRTVGINDRIMYKTAQSRLRSEPHPDINETITREYQDSMALAANAYEAKGIVWWHDHAYGATPSLAAAGLRDYNSFSWSGGMIKVHGSGSEFKINPGNTDAALLAQAYTRASDGGMLDNQQYVIYLDRDNQKEDGTYDVHCAPLLFDDDGYIRLESYINLAYITTGKDQDAGSKEIKGFFNADASLYTIDIPFPNGIVNIEFMNTFSNVLGVDRQLAEAARMVHPNSLTTALLAKGTRPWTSNLAVKPRNNLYNQVMWDNGSSGGASTLTFGNDDTVTISAGNTANLADNTTNYMYLDGTSAGLTGTLPVSFTTTHATATGDAKVLLGLVVVGADATQKSPTILPFNSKAPTLNATVIAADAIIATHVQAGTLGVDKLTSAAQGDISEKTITTASNNAPTSPAPRTGDIWFDTSANPTVIRVYDSTQGSPWVVRNSNAPEGGGATIFSHPQGTPPRTDNSGPNVPNIAVAQYDMWLTTDTNQIYVAQHSSSNTAIAAGQWTLKDDADAINQGTTTIEGGLIRTNRIKLMRGSDGTDPSASNFLNAFETTITGASNTNRLLSQALTAGATATTTFTIDAYQSGQSPAHLQIYAGDILLIGGANSEKVYVTSATLDSGVFTVTVIRGWYTNTVVTHADNDQVWKLEYAVDGRTNPHIILDAYGITGYSNQFTPEFSLSAETGKGTFGGGSIEVGDGGIVFGQGAEASNRSVNWIHNPSSGTGTTFLYRGNQGGFAAGRKLILTVSGTGATAENSALITQVNIEAFAPIDISNSLANITDGSIAISGFKDEDNMASNSATHLATQQSIKAYVDTNGGGGSGTVTSIATVSPILGGTITTTGAISHSDAAGHKHIPTGGASTQVLTYSSSGTATWQAASAHGTHGGSGSGVALGDSPTWTGAHTWTSTMSVNDGTSSALSLRRRLDDTTGFYFYTSGSYEAVSMRAKNRTIWYGYSDGTNDWMTLDAWVDLNNHGITDCNEIQTTNGTDSDPSYTFTNSLTSGMYKGSYGVALTDEGTLSFEVDNTYAYNYKKVYIADIPTGSGGTAIKHVSGTIYEVASTRLAKMDIQDIVIDTSKIYNLQAKSFRYRTQQVNEVGASVIDEDGTKHYTDVPQGGADSTLDFGMIAEEVYEHIPELVSVNPKTNQPIGIDYAAFSVLLLEELKKLKARIDVLEGN
jgi:hypothetical protein